MGRRIRPSLLLDTAPGGRDRGTGGGATIAPPQSSPVSWTYGVITETSMTDASLPPGWVEVGIPYGNPVSRAVGESDGISTWVGARVMVILDTTGRIVKISDPIADPGPDDDVQHLGQAGRRLKQAMDDAVKAQRAADQVRDNAREAENKAAQAAKDAAKALQVGEANRPPHVGPTEPEKPVLGQLWYPTREDGAIIGAKVWDGKAWLPRPLVADQVLVPGSAGSVSIADGAITAPKVYASKEFSAKVGAFLEVTTDMLTAGNATITGHAVVGDLLGNRLVGGEISLLDSAPTAQTQTQDFSAADHGWLPKTKDASVAATGGVLTSTVTSVSATDSSLMAVHASSFGPTSPAEGLTIEVEATPSWNGEVRLYITSNVNNEKASHFVPCKAGEPVILKTALEDGRTLASGNNITLYAVGRQPVGATLTIKSVKATWRQIYTSGLRVYRDASGIAKIAISDKAGGTSIMDSDGVTYTDSAGVTGTRDWSTFVLPPLISASFSYAENTGYAASPNEWGKLIPRDNWTELFQGGFKRVGKSYVVPKSGFYRLQSSVWFRSINEYTVGSGVAINDDATSKNLYTYTTTGKNTWRNVQSTGVRKLAAGDTLALAAYHDYKGTWRISAGELYATYISK